MPGRRRVKEQGNIQLHEAPVQRTQLRRTEADAELGAHIGAPHTQLFDRSRQLLGRELRILHGQRRESGEPIGIALDQLSERVVVTTAEARGRDRVDEMKYVSGFGDITWKPMPALSIAAMRRSTSMKALPR